MNGVKLESRITMGDLLHVAGWVGAIVFAFFQFQHHLDRPCHDQACENIQELREAVVKLAVIVERLEQRE